MTEVRILARFVCNEPAAPYERMKARLWDKDPVSDDMLAEAAPDQEGHLAFQFDLGLASSMDTPAERRPDLYIQVLLDDVEIFRTPVQTDVDFLKPNPVTGLQDHLTQDLGTFQLPDLRGLNLLSRRDFMRSFVEPPGE